MKSISIIVTTLLVTSLGMASESRLACRLNPLLGQPDLKQFEVEIKNIDGQLMVEGTFGEKSKSGPVLSVTELQLPHISELLNCKDDNLCVWKYLGFSESNQPTENDFNIYSVASQINLFTQLTAEFKKLLAESKKAADENPNDKKAQENYQEMLNFTNFLSFPFDNVTSAKMFQIDQGTKFGVPNVTVYFDENKNVVGKVMYVHPLLSGECVDLK